MGLYLGKSRTSHNICPYIHPFYRMNSTSVDLEKFLVLIIKYEFSLFNLDQKRNKE